MTYYSNEQEELARLGIREGELAIYTGKPNPLQAQGRSPDVPGKQGYIFYWQHGAPQERDVDFHQDQAEQNILEVQAGSERYVFLRDKSSGYLRQLSGPAKPVTVSNIGAFPLRVDSFLGKFTVPAGTMLRLDENVPQRKKHKVLLTFSSRDDRLLKAAALWDGTAWRKLNICEDSFSERGYEGRGLTVLDGSAVVQCLTVHRSREVTILDSPEPDPDYEIFANGEPMDEVTLRFCRTEYRDGRVVPRARKLSFSSWGRPVIWDLRKLRESRTCDEAAQCKARLPGLSPRSSEEEEEEGGLLTATGSQRRCPLNSAKLRAFLDGGGAREEAGSQARQGHRAAPVPEPPENFPE